VPEKLFNREDDMQDWLRKEFAKGDVFDSLTINKSYVEQLDPSSFAERRFAASYRMAWKALRHVEVIADNQNIARFKGEILKPDFVLYGQEYETIAVVELKNRIEATREAGTEIGAYAATIRDYLPFLADGDVISVLISSEWPTLLKRFVFNEVVWLGRTVICLQPAESRGRLFLKIIDFEIFLREDSPLKFSTSEFGGFCLCLYDDREQGLDREVMRMRAAGTAMAGRGNALRNHGFSFLWKDCHGDMPAPYCFTIANVAPFQTLSRLLPDRPPYRAVNEIHHRLLKIRREFDPLGTSISLHEIANCAADFLKNCSAPRKEFGSEWTYLERDIHENSAEMIGFYAWGFFAEAFQEGLKAEYERGRRNAPLDCPVVGRKVVNELIDDLNDSG
jgi:hypothetical protein